MFEQNVFIILFYEAKRTLNSKSNVKKTLKLSVLEQKHSFRERSSFAKFFGREFWTR